MALKPTIKSLGYSLKMYWSTESEIESALADLARRIFNQRHAEPAFEFARTSSGDPAAPSAPYTGTWAVSRSFAVYESPQGEKITHYVGEYYDRTWNRIETALPVTQVTWQDSGLDITEYATVREYCRVWRLEGGKLGFLL